jgi:hypothetical protein
VDLTTLNSERSVGMNTKNRKGAFPDGLELVGAREMIIDVDISSNFIFVSRAASVLAL